MNTESGAWRAATLKARVTAVKREVVVRHILRTTALSTSASIRLLLSEVAAYTGSTVVCRRVPDEVFAALDDLADGARYAPCARTILVWVNRYSEGGLVSLLPRHQRS